VAAFVLRVLLTALALLLTRYTVGETFAMLSPAPGRRPPADVDWLFAVFLWLGSLLAWYYVVLGWRQAWRQR
jgi:hypothetical protein